MLVIRNEQMAAFRAFKLRFFEEAIVKNIAAAFPGKFNRWGEMKTREFVRRGVEIGRQHGITASGPLSTLIELMVQFGARFELCPEQAWALDLMAHKTLPGSAKVQLIAERFHELSRGRTIEEVDGEDA